MNQFDVPIVTHHFYGSYYQMGYQAGLALPEDFSDFLQQWIAFLHQKGHTLAQQNYKNHYWKHLDSRLKDLIQGAADAVHLPVDTYLNWQLAINLCYAPESLESESLASQACDSLMDKEQNGGPEKTSEQSPYACSCLLGTYLSSLDSLDTGSTAERPEEGKSLSSLKRKSDFVQGNTIFLARSFDLPKEIYQWVKDYSCVCYYHVEQGKDFSIATVGYLGQFQASTGWNTQGVAIEINDGQLSWPGYNQAGQETLTQIFLALLECANLKQIEERYARYCVSFALHIGAIDQNGLAHWQHYPNGDWDSIIHKESVQDQQGSPSDKLPFFHAYTNTFAPTSQYESFPKSPYTLDQDSPGSTANRQWVLQKRFSNQHTGTNSTNDCSFSPQQIFYVFSHCLAQGGVLPNDGQNQGDARESFPFPKEQEWDSKNLEKPSNDHHFYSVIIAGTWEKVWIYFPWIGQWQSVDKTI